MSDHPDTEWICSACHQSKLASKNSFECGICKDLLCKKCLVNLTQPTFSYLKTVPDELKHTIYCNPCYHKIVLPALESYEDTMNRAKSIYIFEKKITHIPLISRSKQKLTVENCDDRDETILRLAFQAAQLSFNAVVKIELVYEKIRIDGYQTTRWSATGYPANIRVHASQS